MPAGEAFYRLAGRTSYSPITTSTASERACHAPYARHAESWAHAELPHPGQLTSKSLLIEARKLLSKTSRSELKRA